MPRKHSWQKAFVLKISKSKYGSCVDRTIVFLFNVLSDVSRAADNRVTNVGSSFYAPFISLPTRGNLCYTTKFIGGHVVI